MDVQRLSQTVTDKVAQLVNNGFSLDQVSDLCVSDGQGRQFALVDVVFEGGGAKGIGLIGALYALEKLGLRWRKVGGTSAGSILAALLVCNQRHYLEAKSEDILELIANLDFLDFLDGGDDADYLLASIAGPEINEPRPFRKILGLLRNIDDLNRGLGINPGNNFTLKLEAMMAACYGDYETHLGKLKACWDQQAELTRQWNPGLAQHDFRPDFQTVSFDISNHRKATLPRDLGRYAHDSSSINVLDIVRASMSLPFVFEPARMVNIVGGEDNLKTCSSTLLVDGGLIENFPLRLFDQQEWQGCCCPTIGILIDEEVVQGEPIRTPAQFALNLVKGLIEQQWDQLDDPDERARTVFISNRVNNRSLSSLDFYMTTDEKTELFMNGVDAALTMIRDFKPVK